MRVVVLFNLKPGIDFAAFEEWSRTRDIPGVRSLVSVDDFDVYRATGLLGGGTAPYQYIEIMDVADMDGLRADTAGAPSQALAREFLTYAEEPVYILTDPLD